MTFMYPPCFVQLKLRLRRRKMTVYNNYYDPKTTSNLLERVSETDITRTHNFKLKKKSFNTNQYKYFYTNRIVNLWNSLPTHIVNSKLLNTFKNNIDICGIYVGY